MSYQTLCDIKLMSTGGSFDGDLKWTDLGDHQLIWRGHVDVQSMGYKERRDRFGDPSTSRGVVVYFQDVDNPTRTHEITTEMVVDLDGYGTGSIVEVNSLSGFLAIRLL